jgi:hypothetical protein
MFRRILVRLGLKCAACGGWRTIFKRVNVTLAEVTYSDRSTEPVVVKIRPCRSCGYAPILQRTVRLSKRTRVAVDVGEAITYRSIRHDT